MWVCGFDMHGMCHHPDFCAVQWCFSTWAKLSLVDLIGVVGGTLVSVAGSAGVGVSDVLLSKMSVICFTISCSSMPGWNGDHSVGFISASDKSSRAAIM